MKVLFIGIGGVGGYYGGRLAYHSDWDVRFLARGETFEVLRSSPLKVDSIDGDFEVRVPCYDRWPEGWNPDLLVLCVKSYDTRAALEHLLPNIPPAANILCIQNGLDNERIVEEMGFRGRVLPGIAFIGCRTERPGYVVHQSVGGLGIGTLDQKTEPLARKLVDTWNNCQVKTRFLDDVSHARWKKLMWNVPFNSLTAITGTTVLSLLEHPPTLNLVREIMDEVRLVAAAAGVTLTETDIEDMIRDSYDVGDYKTSMLLDLERGKPIENEEMAGAVVRVAERHGISVPLSNTLYRLLTLKSR